MDSVDTYLTRRAGLDREKGKSAMALSQSGAQNTGLLLIPFRRKKSDTYYEQKENSGS
jgi:hypothetical protein